MPKEEINKSQYAAEANLLLKYDVQVVVTPSDNNLIFNSVEDKVAYLKEQLPNLEVSLITSQTEDEEAWLEDRLTGIGGSDIGAICDISNFECAMGIYLQKTRQYPEEELSEFRESLFHFGHVLEAVVAKEYAERTGTLLFDPEVSFRVVDKPWIHINVDRFILDDEYNIVGVLECKTTSEYNAKEWKEGNIPQSYMAQLNWYLMGANVNFGAIACLAGGNKYFYYQFMRNDEWINNTLYPTAQDFWFNHVLKMVEPEFSGNDAATELVNKLYPADKAQVEEKVFKDMETDYALQRFAELKEQIKKLETEMNAVGNHLKNKLGNAQLGVTPSGHFDWKPQVQRRIDTTKLRVEYPQIFEVVQKEIKFKKFNYKLDEE